MKNKYSLKSFAILWTVLFISSFLLFLYILLNLFFSEHITNSSLKDLKYSSHLAKLKLSEEKEKMKNALALHVSSPEFIEFIERKDHEKTKGLVQNWEALHNNTSIDLYDASGALLNLETGKISEENILLSNFAKKQLDLGYEEIEYLSKGESLVISVQRRIFSRERGSLGYLVERKSLPYLFFIEEEDRNLIVRNHSGVVYVTPSFKSAAQLSNKVFAQGASAFELAVNSTVYDVIRVDMAKGLTFFIARENLRGIIFKSFYEKYFIYFLFFLALLSIIFYISYYRQVFRPLAQLSDFILNEKGGDDEIVVESSLREISIISEKLSKRISTLNTDVEANKVGRVNDVARLVSSVAHELNNSLSYLGGNLSYLKEEFSAPEQEMDSKEVLEALESAESGYNRIKNIVADLKVFSTKTSLTVKWVDLESILKQLKAEFSGLDFSFPEELKNLEVKTDQERVAQIVRNLVQNAHQAYGEQKGQKVLISFFKDQNEITISVKDWAGGVPPEVVKNVFEPFFTTKRNIGGAGLGLSVSQNLAREIEGDLKLQETNKEGSVFCLTLKHFRSKV